MYSTLAYQQVSLSREEVPVEDLLWRLTSLTPPPHILVYLDVTPRVAMRRISRERTELHLYEEIHRLEKVRANFHRILELISSESAMLRHRVDYWKLYMDENDVNCLYTPPQSWPKIIWINEIKNSVERSVEEVAIEVAEKVIQQVIKNNLVE
jgi:hypothetical protein